MAGCLSSCDQPAAAAMGVTSTGQYRSRPRRPTSYPKPGQLAGEGGKYPPCPHGRPRHLARLPTHQSLRILDAQQDATLLVVEGAERVTWRASCSHDILIKCRKRFSEVRITPVRLAVLMLAIGTILSGGESLRAMPPSPNPVEVEQPDGKKITLRIRGGERFHWFEDLNGFTVVLNKTQVYVYAALNKEGELIPTRLEVGKVNPAAAGISKGVLPMPEVRRRLRAESLSMPPMGMPRAAMRSGVLPTGVVKNLVVLCKFSDHTFGIHTRPEADYSVLWNAVGGDPVLAPTGSIRDVFSENSYGVLTLESTVAVWVTLPQTEAYYANGTSGLGGFYPQNPQGMVEHALNLVDPLVDFGQFDQDNDGFIDAISIVHSGFGAETGGGGGIWIWSHKWSLWQLPGGLWTSADTNGIGVNVRVFDYHTEPALWGTSGSQISRIGVAAHETGHFFGLPDLYDTDGGGQGIGSYGMMANSWGFNNDQLNPPHFSAWSKIFLGWVTPTIITSPGVYNAPQSQTNPTVFRIDSGYPVGEYLLIENRQPAGFDSAMPQGGLAIWHIDEYKGSIQQNDVNTDEGFPGQASWPANNNHYRVALLQADGSYDLEHGNNPGDSGDLYHSGGVSEISETTIPNTNAYQDGTVIVADHYIANIGASGPNMSFSYSGAEDCNNSFLSDDCDIACGSTGGPCDVPGCGASQDCNVNGIPDECETDCNSTGLPDDCDIALGNSDDLNANGVPDECELIIHVDNDAASGGDGLNWATALDNLQGALSLAALSSGTVPFLTILVAQGTYTAAPPGGDRNATFQLLNNVSIEGGYAGLGEPDPDARDAALYPTILSGDLNGNDAPAFVNYAENSYHVVTGSGTDSTAILDGFIIAGGNSNQPVGQGGGMRNVSGNPTITECTFRDNSAEAGGGMANLDASSPTILTCKFENNRSMGTAGGAMFNIDGSSPLITSCTFLGNTANGGNGGAIDFRWGSNATITSCSFQDNAATGAGGAIYATNVGAHTITLSTFRNNTSAKSGGGIFYHASDDVTLSDCTFDGNTTSKAGGGLGATNSDVTMTNCTIIGNQALSIASGNGGGGVFYQGARGLFVNCVFSGNTTLDDGGGFGSEATDTNATFVNCTFSANLAQGSGGGLYKSQSGNLSLVNCIVWGNSDASGTGESAQVLANAGTLTVNYSCVENLSGVLGGVGNIGDDPLLVDADGVDNQSGTEDDDLHLSSVSPCVNRGDNQTPNLPQFDFEEESRIQHCTVDIGADESPHFFDCNNNTLVDGCEILAGTSTDCNRNGVLDECETAQNDCNANGVPDDCDPDCDGDLVPDACEIALCAGDPLCSDCNTNGIPDECEFNNGPLSPPNGAIWNPLNDHYYLITPSLSWPDAEAMAVSLGGHLVTIRNQVENQWLVDTFGQTGYQGAHIGINDIAIEGTFVWASGEFVAFTNWDTGEPNNAGNEDWGLIVLTPEGSFSAGEWNDDRASRIGIAEIAVSKDCNGNGLLDECDIASMRSEDCNGNSIPDECEPGGSEDCNTNGTSDLCDILLGTSADCNDDSILDECQLTNNDCNMNGIPDECEQDCNANSMPDDCDIISGSSLDCQANGFPDECDIVPSQMETFGGGTFNTGLHVTWTNPSSGPGWFFTSSSFALPGDVIESVDIGNGEATAMTAIFDFGASSGSISFDWAVESEVSCCDPLRFDIDGTNLLDRRGFDSGSETYSVGPGIHIFEWRYSKDGTISAGADAAAIDNVMFTLSGTIGDCNTNGVPDECEITSGASLDCNNNTIPDECEPGGTMDCNGNGQSDLCDLVTGTSLDCNSDGIPDDCQLAGNDCNANGIPDDCEPDCDGDHVPDECEIISCLPGDLSCGDCNANGLPDGCELAVARQNRRGGVASAHGWPTEHASNPPSLVLDGDLATFTWTTASPNFTQPSYLGLFLGSLSTVEVVRMWKDNFSGSAAPNSKNLVIQYTTDPVPDLGSGAWSNVTGMINGFNGTELLVATSVNLDGTVIADVHDSVNDGHGWASLTFDRVQATGVRIGFSFAGTESNHYKVHELQAFSVSTADCNGNGVLDECDIADSFSLDCDGSGIPDECESLADCNINGIPDLCDISNGTSLDCNNNAVPDDCDLPGDMNGDGVVNDGDVDGFIGDLLLGPCGPLSDMNGDGTTDGGDIQGFIDDFLGN